jgi:hypothetical protein
VNLRTEPETWYATVEVLGLIPLISRGERCGRVHHRPTLIAKSVWGDGTERVH